MRYALLCVALAAGCGKKAESGGGGATGAAARKETGRVPGVVDLQELAAAYGNEAAGDAKYTGKRFTALGYVKRVEKAGGGDHYKVTFEYFVDGVNWGEGRVLAFFPASEAGKLAKCEYRSPLHFDGRCDGQEPGTLKPVVVLRDCKVVPAPPDKP